MVKLIAADLDGTLLDSGNRIDRRTLSALQRAIEQGILVVPASGRCLGVFPWELTSLTGMRYAVTENGALVWDYKEEQEWSRVCLPARMAEAILRKVQGMEVFAEVFIHGQAYADIRSLEGIGRTQLGSNFIRYFTENHNFQTNLAGESDLLETAEKVNLYFEDSQDAASVRRTLKADPSIGVTSSIGGNVEITAAGVDKGRALTDLARKLGIKREEILVFGDNENDLGMFAAGTAVAMGNSAETIRRSADAVTAGNDECGVAVYLENEVLSLLKN